MKMTTCLMSLRLPEEAMPARASSTSARMEGTMVAMAGRRNGGREGGRDGWRMEEKGEQGDRATGSRAGECTLVFHLNAGERPILHFFAGR